MYNLLYPKVQKGTGHRFYYLYTEFSTAEPAFSLLFVYKYPMRATKKLEFFWFLFIRITLCYRYCSPFYAHEFSFYQICKLLWFLTVSMCNSLCEIHANHRICDWNVILTSSHQIMLLLMKQYQMFLVWRKLKANWKHWV